ncbi:peptidoglycan DD-metalloendopeptidase family protein [Paraclostridium bifermentans]|uniref:Peptidoglycan DD-metalloendopeptidase family protein n=1 Tax=Paraclostridium bifermentans TaxID=1490 RepID=A0ABY8R4K6_PARBF|nr:peptidoglycan DD-metalloendopeptidase family protein [Paraclostridium bifermentans]
MIKSLKILMAVGLITTMSALNIYGVENENSASEQIVKDIYNLKIEQRNINEKISDIDKSIEEKKLIQQESNDVEVVQLNFVDDEDSLNNNKDLLKNSVNSEIKALEDSKLSLNDQIKNLEDKENNLKNEMKGKVNYGSWPVPGFTELSSPFGYRIHPISKERKFHKGVDIPADYGTEVLATDYGVVSFSGVQNGYGNVVAIKHFDGKTSIYGHNSKNIVNEGDLVYKGQPIAKVGSTGRSTGNHVHFEVTINGELKNPLEITSK